MNFKIDTTLKRIYDIDYVRFDLEENIYSSVKDIEKFNLLDMVNYLIERQNKYIIDKIILALNDNECQVIKFDAYEG